MKNPFKKSSFKDTLINVGIGGGANALIDIEWEQVGMDAMLEPITKNSEGAERISADTLKNIIKIAGGAVVGGMVSGKYGRAAADGVATVGASNLIAGLIEQKPATGLPEGTIGRVRRLGQRGFKRAKIAGVSGADFMSC